VGPQSLTGFLLTTQVVDRSLYKMVSDVAPKDGRGNREKRLVAFSSLMAAVFLTGTKLTIGLLTQSLGILSEAAHSGLDLIAAAITFYSVRISGRPPDDTHHYGHGKIENLSALVETLLLFITCVWIVYEAVERLFYRPVQIEVTMWSFIVMGVSIIIDLSRSRALMKTAKKYGSQALEADALHFSTDVWSSSVVILGLILVFISRPFATRFPELSSWLSRADAIAALGVSAIVLLVSYRLGRRTVNALLDRAPDGTANKIREKVMVLPGVSEVRSVRVRPSGPATFVDMTLEVSDSKSFEESHEIAQQVESVVGNMVMNSDVIVHVEPVSREHKTLLERVRSVARKHGINIHDVYSNDVNGQTNLELHAEVPENITVSEAHYRVTVVEEALHREFPELDDIVVHIDPVGDDSLHHLSDFPVLSGVHEEITETVRQVDGIQNCHSIIVFHEHNHLVTSFHCTVSPHTPVFQAHELTNQVENLLRERLTPLERITIHLEPCDEHCQVCNINCQYKPVKS
jgi:cation diffusion facilitator family transporter